MYHQDCILFVIQGASTGDIVIESVYANESLSQ